MVTLIVKVHVYCWKYHPCVKSLHTCRNEDIYELKRVHIANFEVDLCSSSVEYCSISNVTSLSNVLVNSAVLLKQ